MAKREREEDRATNAKERNTKRRRKRREWAHEEKEKYGGKEVEKGRGTSPLKFNLAGRSGAERSTRPVRPTGPSVALFLSLLLRLCFFFSAFHVGFSIPIQRGASEPNYYDSSPPDSVGPFDLPPFSMIPRYLGRLCCPGWFGGGTLVQ
ncbi:hypothetical protein ALC57_07288 [Trachymyrmex cornetzi]|uniref:Transmembrane protein n=1 Tax=Trachymyrmex cornetzi TaxID=471704 RepID=A0A195E5E7_9HYME|nr:hypothetical protein ALC57_07288 [Trachymyrmex cornetzi]